LTARVVRPAPLPETASVDEALLMLNTWDPTDVAQVLGVTARLHSYVGFLVWLLIGARQACPARRTSSSVR